jgi:hypothetical protein
MNKEIFQLGNYRPIYLWAGPGTVRMNKLKFMQVPVNESVHLQAHQNYGATIVIDRMNQNWPHLTYSWGFPPEIEIEDWNSFQEAADIYHGLGKKVFAYIQTSNCVYKGSFVQKNWYARNPSGKKFHYYTNRYMTCFHNNGWINYLKERINDAIIRGADGIFFDNMWYGCQPSSLLNTWLGSAGCYCPDCKAIYEIETGRPIPVDIITSNQDVLNYLTWRANQMSAIIAELSAYARSIKSNVVISANDYDCIMRPSYLIYGIDFQALSKIQDISMIENFALPEWRPEKKIRFTNNALTIRNARPFLENNQHLSVLSYQVGIGFDPVYSTRRYLQGMAEATALGASMTIKGTEYHDGTAMTLISASEYFEQQSKLGEFNKWLENHQDIYKSRVNLAWVGLLHPEDDLWINWFQLAPSFFGCAQTLTANGFPWKVVKKNDSLSGIRILLRFIENKASSQEKYLNSIQVIEVHKLPGWEIRNRSFLEKHKIILRTISSLVEGLIRSYHSNKITRKILDMLGMAKLVTTTPLYFMPALGKQLSLLNNLPDGIYPRVISSDPVLLEIWKKSSGEIQYHLVNYADKHQTIQLFLPGLSSGIIVDQTKSIEVNFINQDQLTIDLDTYVICIIKDTLN